MSSSCGWDSSEQCEGEGTARLLQEVYLHVVVVPARQLQLQLTFGPGTAIPQPADLRGQLHLVDKEVQGRCGTARATTERERGGRGEEK